MKRIFFSMILIMVFCSCEHREASTDTDMEVVFDWQKLVEGDIKSPKMEVHCYKGDNSEHIVVRGNQDGAKLFIPYDTYKLLAFSSDVKNVGYRGLESYSTAEAYAETSASGILLQPGSLYVAHKDLVLSPDDKTIHSLLLAPYIKRLALSIDLSGETGRVAGCKFTLSGIASGVNLSTGKVIYSPSHTYSIESPAVTSLPLKTTLSFFGCDETKNIITIEIALTDNTVTSVEADITEALENINDPNSPGIEIKPEITIEQDPATGFKATLTGWKVGTGSGTIGGK